MNRILITIAFSSLYLGMFCQFSGRKFQKISVEQGVSSVSVRSVYQDKDGFIWVCTRNGIDRFDGYNFKKYELPINDSISIDNFERYFVDSEGYKYIGTRRRGFVVIDPISEKGSIYFHDKNNPSSISEDFIQDIYEDSKGQIWVSTLGGLNLFDKTSGKFKRLLHNPENDNSLSENRIYSIAESSEGQIWIATENRGVNVYDQSSDTYIHHRHDPSDPTTIAGDNIYDLTIDHLGRVWCASYGSGLSYYDPKQKRFFRINADDNNPSALSSQRVYCLELDAIQKGLWVGTQDKGVCYLDFETMNFTRYQHSPNDANSLATNDIDFIFSDQENNTWIATASHGLNMINPTSEQFKRLQYDPFDPSSIRSNQVKTIHEDIFENIWIGYVNKGVDRYDKNFKTVIRYSSEAKDSKYRISDNNINHITSDSKGNIVVSTKYGGVNIINSQGTGIKYYNTASNDTSSKLLDNWIFNCLVTANDEVYVASIEGIDVIENFEIREQIEVATSNIRSQHLYHLFEDSRGRIWIESAAKGLDRYDPKTGEIQAINNNFDPLFFENDLLWYTKENNIESFHLITEERNSYPLKEEIKIQDILIDQNENMWLSTLSGLWKHNIDSGRLHQFTRDDGMSTNLLSKGSIRSTKTGQLYFTSDQGIISFHPNDIQKSNFVPNIAITSLNYLSSKSKSTIPIEVNGINEKKEIRFPFHHNIISIDFAALSYSKTAKNKYRYKVDGLFDNWIDLQNERSITLTNLDPKTYTLRINGSSGDGIWNEEEKSLKITITPPWWKSTLAYISYVIALMLSIWAFTRYRINEQKRKLLEERKVVERLQEVDKLKDQFLANTSHELRTPLNGIIGLSESLRDGVAGKLSKEAISNLNMIIGSGKRLSNLVNDILDFSKLKNHELQLKLIGVDLRAATSIVISILRPLYSNKNLVIKNEISNDLPLVHADENRVQQILNNIIGNAIKFTHEGSVIISAEVKNGEVVTTISDTGIGIPEDKFDKIFQSFDQLDGDISREYGGSGLGLSVTKQLVEQHGGNITIDSILDKGTNVSFSLPISSQERDDKLVDIDHEVELVNELIDEEVEVQSNVQFGDDLQSPKILVVDDEPINRQVLLNHLALSGYKVTVVNDGPSAIEAIRNDDSFNLILLDVMMPRMSGLEVADVLRKEHSASELPIIMITAKNRVNDLVEGFNVGANDYLTKPVSKHELLSRIRTHLNLHNIHSATSKFVPDAFIKTVGRKSITEVRLGDYAEKEVSVLFTDIRDYTRLSEQMTPKDTFRFVKSYVGKMGPIIQKNNGFVNQYLGDGLMCIFDKNPDDALRACVEMQMIISDYNLTRIKKGRSEIRVGMGLYTGQLVMGIIGDEKRNEPTSISSSVNSASRIEGLTKHFGARILMAKESLDALEDPSNFNFRYLGKSKVKGQEHSIELYECINADSKDQFDKKLKSTNKFNQAIHDFIDGEFEKAKNSFEEIYLENVGDQVALYFLTKCNQFLNHGKPREWSGIIKMEVK